ncbi:Dolichyl-phosphate-mannose-protein mannosyltransferase [Hymenobacter gelipurpurascens]|uniref:Dolichyl-phosphate-mannose-protein mannosyltransferase n=1 Tax=Hymenobacter gelipurpurascens TaxID=89968 RepID=A0A212T8W1_9BACT|nr:glycosyltransferase family 39 protein [Hymenobacter gelipurpurascens]SNC62459.1 Dolichyl-phosphate-mannose-protein mannosyltransferase [Hymenobacter gelipurpurascens]
MHSSTQEKPVAVNPHSLFHICKIENNSSQLLLWSFICAGIFLRIFHYVDNRSFWIDEIYLNTSIIKMNFCELATTPLYYEQKAPLGYLWLVRLTVILFGKSEMALRLVSLLCGVVTLLIFLPVTRYFLRSKGVVVAMALIALAPPIIYHSVEAKQYSMELMASVLCLFLYIRYKQELTWKSQFIWGLWGASILWFSHSSIFILVGIALGCGLTGLLKKDWKLITKLTLPCTMWASSFIINYALFTYKSSAAAWLTAWFEVRSGFMPLSADTPKWLYRALSNLLNYPLGILWKFSLPEASILALVIKLFFVLIALTFIGLSIVKLYRNNSPCLIVLLSPVVLTLLASCLKIYPFYERLTLFLAPIFILLLVIGSSRLADLLPVSSRRWSYVVFVLLLIWPLCSSTVQAINPQLFGGTKKQYYRESLLYLDQHYQKGDVVYIYWNTLPAYRFYKEAYNLKFKAIKGKDARYVSHNAREYFQRLAADKEILVGKKRVWFLYEREFVINIGEYDNQPNWYYALRPESGNLFYSYIADAGKVIHTYKNAQHTVSVLDLSMPKNGW